MILITGASGQLGFDLVEYAKKEKLAVLGTGSEKLDITDSKAVDGFFDKQKISAIIHSAAYTAVDKAEDEKEVCWNVNVFGTGNLVHHAKRLNIPFMFISTDYVFDGNKKSDYEIQDPVNPMNVYGASKAEAENIIKNELTKFFILRISWVYGKNGNNFIKTMLRLAQKRDEINVVSDQIGSPTYTKDLAPLIFSMLGSKAYGIHHATNEGVCSWAELAQYVFDKTGSQVKVNGIKTSDYPTKAKRPQNSVLSKSDLDQAGFKRLPHWKDAVDRFLKEIGETISEN